MIEGPIHSDVRVQDWAVVQDQLLQGMLHACNNRLAALAGVLQLQEHGLAEPAEGIAAVSGEFTRMREMMDVFRLLTPKRGATKEAIRLEEALRTALGLLKHHHGARRWTLALGETAGAQPVLLWPADAVRIPVLLWLAGATGTPEGRRVEASVAGVGSETVVSVFGAGSEAAVRASAEFAALQHAATAVGGALGCAPGTETASVTLTLAVPALGRS